MVSDNLNSRKLLKGRESRIQVALPIFVGYALVLCFSLGDSWEEVLHVCKEYIPKAFAFINYNERGNLYSITCFGTLHLKIPASLYFTSPISRSSLSFVDKMLEGILSSFTLLFVVTFHICIFCCCVESIYQTFPKGGQQNGSNVFQPSMMNSSLHLFIFDSPK